MASGQPFDLKGAVSDFSIGLIRAKITQLKSDYDKDLEEDAAQIRTLLRSVDQKRLKFHESRRDLLDGLRSTLTSLNVDGTSVDAVAAELETVTPAWLGVIPSASSLLLQPPTPAQSSPPLSDINTPEDPAEASPLSDIDTPRDPSEASPPLSDLSTPPDPAEELSQKRRQDDAEADQPPDKRLKTDVSDEEAGVAQPHAPRKLHMSELDNIECVFTHSEMEGFWVIRCPAKDCTLRISDHVPFKNRRAFNHFNSRHLHKTQPEEYIFNQFAYKVDDATAEAVAARYDGGRIPECTPSREIVLTTPAPLPSGPARRTRRLAAHPTSGSDASASESDPEYAPEGSGARHNLRQRPKPSYLSLSQGRKPPEPEAQAHTARAKPVETRKPKNPPVYKPFGHLGEWPRRSAPS